MALNIFQKLIEPRYPPAAVSIERGKIITLQLDRTRNGFNVRRAAAVNVSESLISPDFEAESNVTDLGELSAAISDAALSAGLGKHKKWSFALPEASTRSIIITLETNPATKSELEEVLRWKSERGFGVEEDLLQVSRERLSSDSAGRARFIATAVRKSVLAEFETVFESLGWRAGLILPRSVAESQWLTATIRSGDSLMVSSHDAGFTAGVFRGNQPVAVRSILCEDVDRQDELYRFLLFYRDRVAGGTDENSSSIHRLLLAGSGFNREAIVDLANETLETDLQPLMATDLGLNLPASDFSFSELAAPAAMAAMAW